MMAFYSPRNILLYSTFLSVKHLHWASASLSGVESWRFKFLLRLSFNQFSVNLLLLINGFLPLFLSLIESKFAGKVTELGVTFACGKTLIWCHHLRPLNIFLFCLNFHLFSTKSLAKLSSFLISLFKVLKYLFYLRFLAILGLFIFFHVQIGARFSS